MRVQQVPVHHFASRTVQTGALAVEGHPLVLAGVHQAREVDGVEGGAGRLEVAGCEGLVLERLDAHARGAPVTKGAAVVRRHVVVCHEGEVDGPDEAPDAKGIDLIPGLH